MSDNMDLQKIRNQLERNRGRYQSIRERLDSSHKQKGELEVRQHSLEKATIIIQEVSKLTQQEVEFHVSDLVSHGLAAVFDDPYTYRLEYTLRRDRTEADQYWERGDSHFLPNGGGVRDVSAFALHIACVVLSLMQKREVKPILILDEPTRCLKPSALQERAGIMIQEISETLGIQIILITHDSALSDQADKVFEIKLDERRVSHVKGNG